MVLVRLEMRQNPARQRNLPEVVLAEVEEAATLVATDAVEASSEGEVDVEEKVRIHRTVEIRSRRKRKS